MKVLLINKFLYPRGGDAISVLETGELLRQHGHEVVFWGMKHPANPTYPNSDLFIEQVDYSSRHGFGESLRLTADILYNREAQRRLSRLIDRERPDVVHLHNFAHQISPSIIPTIKKYQLPLVMTMHDYKLICPVYRLFLRGRPCTSCRDGRYYHCFLNRCAMDSWSKSLVNTLEMYLHHRILHLYDLIDVLISPSRFLIRQLKDMGLQRPVVYLPNFVQLKEGRPVQEEDVEPTLVFLGRLHPYKDILTLLAALKDLPKVKLKIIGDGPQKQEIQDLLRNRHLDNVSLLGHLPPEAFKDHLRSALALVLPSLVWENNPRVVLEAFAAGKPVIGSDVGGIPELVRPGQTGLLFRPGDASDLRAKINQMLNAKDLAQSMGQQARHLVEQEFSPDNHYQNLMKIYQQAARTSESAPLLRAPAQIDRAKTATVLKTSPAKVLLINKFLFQGGGSDVSTLMTGQLLEQNGHEVVYWGMKHPANGPFPYQDLFVDQIDYKRPAGPLSKIRLAAHLLYSIEASCKLAVFLDKTRPDIVHLNNIAHQISPSILPVLKKHGLPIIMTLRDYKLVCPTYVLFRQGHPCEKCRGGHYYYCWLNHCTKKSYSKSLINTLEMYLHHNLLHFYDLIDKFISPSRFLQHKIAQMGWDRPVHYLPNFVPAAQIRPVYDWQERSVVYFGRLSPEKGLTTAIRAIKDIPDLTLKIIGQGPCQDELEELVRVENIGNIRFLGFRSGPELNREVTASMFAIMPSEWYENNPRSILESQAWGKPVIGSRIGGIPELVRDGETGLCFEPGNVQDLKEKILRLKDDPDLIKDMGHKARQMVEREFDPDSHYQGLMEIYRLAAG